MNVIDLLKEKSDRLAKNRAELMELVNPQVRGYFNDAINNARNNQWLGWVLDQTKLGAGSETQQGAHAWPEKMGSDAQEMLQQLSAQMNQVTLVGEWLTVDQERINRFAEVTDDHQWIHTDVERAKEHSPFGGTIAHGFLTLALLPKLIGAVNPDTPPYPGAKMVVNLGLNQVRYPYPVKTGSRLRASKKVIHVALVRRGLEVTEEITVEIQGCRRPACVAQTLMLLVF
ncbi:MaoC family dehydratase [Reinekea sp.]|jgi:acyl dehydratase|uniref:MaoC family dehydratase n=1 Tax=Reinekea sp. TaxID=1970455 RepID=UPI002A809900|nr:MaoC family dehydratase [Reinekea sp.]